MKPSRFSPLFSLLVVAAAGGPAHAHITLEQPRAVAGAGYKAVLRVSHGCEGTATHTLTVRLPAGFRGAKPMPKPGWLIDIVRAPLAQPYESHGRQVTEDVVQITWKAATPAAALPDTHYDEFVVRGQAPALAGPAWFRVQQVCERGQWDWSEVPATGIGTRGLKSPAVLLEVDAAPAASHVH